MAIGLGTLLSLLAALGSTAIKGVKSQKETADAERYKKRLAEIEEKKMKMADASARRSAIARAIGYKGGWMPQKEIRGPEPIDETKYQPYNIASGLLDIGSQAATNIGDPKNTTVESDIKAEINPVAPEIQTDRIETNEDPLAYYDDKNKYNRYLSKPRGTNYGA